MQPSWSTCGLQEAAIMQALVLEKPVARATSRQNLVRDSCACGKHCLALDWVSTRAASRKEPFVNTSLLFAELNGWRICLVGYQQRGCVRVSIAPQRSMDISLAPHMLKAQCIQATRRVGAQHDI
eukprot:4931370-Amphidinium_carterae.2